MRRTLGILCLVAAAAQGAAAQDAAKYFQDNCAPCHSIGSPGAAPDLKDVTKRRAHEWLVHFILDPEDAAKTDPSAAALVKQHDGVVMPKADGITGAMADALLRYIDEASGAAAPAPTTSAAPAATRAVTDADIQTGRELYEGRRTLARGGPACVSCHQLNTVAGNSTAGLGPDLTLAAKRLGGARGLTGWLRNPPTKVMRALFRDRAMNDEEVFAIVALLDRAQPAGTSGTLLTARSVPAAGAAIAVLLLALIGFVWSRRFRAVRRPLVESARIAVGAGR
jgi:mono/diheme cytochrome c family protein